MNHIQVLVWLGVLSLFSCSKSEFYREQDIYGEDIWSARPKLERGDHSIRVNITPPYMGNYNYRDPDYFVILYSSDPNNFTDSTTAEYYEPYVDLSGLNNGTPYYVKIRTYKEGFEMTESTVRIAIPGQSRSIEDVDFTLSKNVKRFTVSPTGKNLVLHPPGDDRLHFYDIETNVKTTVENHSFLGSWNHSGDKFLFSNTIIQEGVTDRIVDTLLVIYDLNDNSLDTVVALDQTIWSYYTPFFGTNNDEVIYQTNATVNDQKFSEIWSYNRLNETTSLLFSFEDINFTTFINHQVIFDHKLIFSGWYTDSGEIGLYELDLRSKELSPIIISDFSHTNPVLSPNRKRILFSSRRTGREQLWVYDTTENKLDQITDHQNKSLDFRSFHWKDNDEIYILQYNNSDGTTEIKQMKL